MASLRGRLRRWGEAAAGFATERLGPLRHRVMPHLEVLSAAAWGAIVLVLAAWLAAARWHWREAAVIAVFTAVVLAIAAVYVIGRHRLSAEFGLSADRVVVGDPAAGRLIVTNRSARRSLASTVHLPVGAGSADFDLPRLAAEAEHEELFSIPTAHRAVISVGPVVAVRSDPFGLLRRLQSLTGVEELYVHPRTIAVEGSAAGLVRDLEGQVTHQLSESDMSFHALRDYVPGDDRRYIHWRHSARTGNLMVRQFEQTRRSHLLIVLSTDSTDYADPEEFELAVSVAGSLGVQALVERQTVTAVTSTRALSTPTPRRYLDQLSGVDYERRAADVPSAVRRLGHQSHSASVAVLICGSRVEARDLRRAQRHLPLDVRTIAVRCASTESTSVRRLGLLDVLTLAHLDELSRGFRGIA